MGYTPKGSPNFIGDPKAPTASFGDSDNSIANTEFVSTNFVSLAGSQTISGAKLLTNNLTISDKKISFDDMSLSSDIIIDSLVSGESDERFILDASGKMSWGSGAAAADITLERINDNVLQMGTDNILRVSTSPTNIHDVVNKEYVDAIVITGGNLPTKTVSANYSPSPSTDYTLLVDTTSGAVTITLPLSPTSDTRFEIKDKFGTSDTNPIYIIPSGSELIDTTNIITIQSSFQSVTAVYDGFDWFIT